MNEKTTLLPTAPQDFADGSQPPSNPNMPDVVVQGASQVYPVGSSGASRIIIVPGLEFDASRKYRYGLHALAAGILLFVSFVIIEIRDCNWGPGIDLDRLQALHISLMIFALMLYLLSLFGIADFLFKYRIIFMIGTVIIFIFVGLFVWMTYEAATNPCKKSSNFIPVDFSFDPNKNVFSSGDAYGIIVLLLDIVGTISILSAATNFWKRY